MFGVANECQLLLHGKQNHLFLAPAGALSQHLCFVHLVVADVDAKSPVLQLAVGAEHALNALPERFEMRGASK